VSVCTDALGCRRADHSGPSPPDQRSRARVTVDFCGHFRLILRRRLGKRAAAAAGGAK
jgi:hypothetical protein